MHSRKRTKTLTNYVSSRLTSDEEQRINRRAEMAGLTKSEWCRQAILRALDVSPDSRLIVAEILALRRMFLALQIDEIHGQKPSEERLSFLISQADLYKRAMTEARVRDFLDSELRKETAA